MEIKLTRDPKLTEEICRNPQVWKEITWGFEDTDNPSFRVKMGYGRYHFIGYVDDVPIAAAQALKALTGKYYCHIQVLPQYRSKYGLEVTYRFLDKFWYVTSPGEVSDLYLLLPPELRHIMLHVLKVGFKKIDFGVYFPDSLSKRNPNLKRWLLKLNREDYNVRRGRCSK